MVGTSANTQPWDWAGILRNPQESCWNTWGTIKPSQLWWRLQLENGPFGRITIWTMTIFDSALSLPGPKIAAEIFFMEGLAIPLGAVSDHVMFGFPAPMACYVEIVEGKVVKEHQASHWLYTTMYTSM